MESTYHKEQCKKHRTALGVVSIPQCWLRCCEHRCVVSSLQHSPAHKLLATQTPATCHAAHARKIRLQENAASVSGRSWIQLSGNQVMPFLQHQGMPSFARPQAGFVSGKPTAASRAWHSENEALLSRGVVAWAITLYLKKKTASLRREGGSALCNTSSIHS